MSGVPDGRPRAVSEAELARAASHPRTSNDDDEDALIEAAIAESEADSRDRGDTRGRLDEWRTAERAMSGIDPATAAGRQGRDDADAARSAYHEAESLQRERHGLSRIGRLRRLSDSVARARKRDLRALGAVDRDDPGL